ncbi:bifunctional metallophosphatase/5'-nucleotidase [Kyrpidia spormannii]|uniref:Bifunctional metallophosphatase/5'-nucleotidase n=2 Tax=Kyrpidia spormannii TaxID=2055160 RepID=A0ACA8ZC91_9BACL|nr:bifunctional metallophosphatase/5'-nucleotidase [Kyrpidia spormannii]CAB3394057.1 Bifunctional metallophosphatase/5'-nucleotidase [Kyrpidia spormannii]CAB3394995.1 Bifunctional metallophosphatase/5'-nucleotidase [Kyrpidia spormannii]
MCQKCGDDTHVEKKISRRDMLKYMGAFGLGLGMFPLVTGLASGLNRDREIAATSSRVKRLTFLQTTDIHGQVLTHPEFFWENNTIVFRRTGGMSRIATLFQRVRAENPGNVFIIDTGDCYQGSALAALSKGRAMVRIMNRMGYDLAIPGNWEVVYGSKALVDLSRSYNFPVICSNMVWNGQGPQPNRDLFPEYYIKELGGVRIGFIGYNDPLTKVRQSPAWSKEIQFGLPTDSIPRLVDILRNNYKCQLVMMLCHLGLTQQVYLAKQPQCQGVDFLFGGDTHERTYEPILGGHCPVVEPGSFGSFVGRLDVVVEDGRIKDYTYKLLVVDENQYPEDPAIKSVVEAERKPYLPVMERKIGETKGYLYRYNVLETPMDNLITDAIREATGADIGFSNGFRFSPPIPPGDLTVEHLYSILPTNSQLEIGRVTGKQIWDWMEKELENVFSPDPAKRVGGWVVRFSGMQVTMTIANPYGKRVQSITIGGEPLQPNKTYTIAACVREGEDPTVLCRFKNVRDPHILDLDMFQAIENFLKKKGPVQYEIEGRVKATDAHGFVLSQLPGTTYTFH